MASNAPEPRLPPELERHIFLLAAQSSRPPALVPVLRVAKRVRTWVEPHLYRVLWFDAMISDRHERLLKNLTPEQNVLISKHTLGLWLSGSISLSDTIDLLKISNCVENLNLFLSGQSIFPGYAVIVAPHLVKLPLKRLAIGRDSHSVFTAIFLQMKYSITPSWLSQLTHLLIASLDGLNETHDLSLFPSLTHFGFYGHLLHKCSLYHARLLKSLLNRPGFRACALFFCEEESFKSLQASIADASSFLKSFELEEEPRIVVAADTPPGNIFLVWEEGARYRNGFWEGVDRAVDIGAKTVMWSSIESDGVKEMLLPDISQMSLQ